jgi:hypothetical protein
MPDLKFTNDKGQTFEITGISVEEIAKLAGLNGNGHAKDSAAPIAVKPGIQRFPRESDYEGFKKKLTAKAKQFVVILSQNPNGINADHLAGQLGFQSGVQLGGMAGGGMAKHADEFNVDLSRVYTREKLFANGVRRVIYKPGADLNELL